MFSADASFLAGYIEGESYQRRIATMDDLVAAATGNDVVEIRRRDLNALQARLQNTEAYARQENRTAGEWKDYAQMLERQNAALNAKVAELNSVTRERNALFKFFCMAGHVLQAHRNGHDNWPEFSELRDFALDIARKHLQGELYDGLGEQPEKRAWYNRLWDALN